MKTIGYALAGAVLLVAGTVFLFQRAAPNSDPTADSRPGRWAALQGDDTGVDAAGGRRGAGVAGSTGAPAGEEVGGPIDSAAARSRSGRRLEAGTGGTRVASGTPTDDGANSDGDHSPLAGKLVQSGPLAGAALSAAIEAALEAEDLSTLQGLLISELTMEGTQFSAEDLPALLSALNGVDDFGMEKLLLTHLDRIDVHPEELVGGYLDYLEGSKKPMHLGEVLERITKIGGDAATEGLSELVRQTPNERLRREAALALAETGDPRGTPAIREALFKAASPEAAGPYLSALARMGNEPAISTLIDYAARTGSAAGLRALREVKAPDAAPLLAGELDPRGDQPFQQALLRKLRDLGDARALPQLGRYLDRAQQPMLTEALRTVERIPDYESVRVLEQFAEHSGDPRLAAWARRSAEKVRKRVAKAAETEAKRASQKRAPRPPKTPKPSKSANAAEKKRKKAEARRKATG